VLYGHEVTFDTSVPDGFWMALAAIVGSLVGMLIPFSLPALQRDLNYRDDEQGAWKRDKWDLPSIAAIAVAVASSVAIIACDIPLLFFAIAGLLLGLLIPSPARRD
jgi:hypothetical protein